ncbi:hypothetical protein C4D60_Mb04t06860 [Musa balbisiana]|uniref:Protein EARLY HEADING DATE 2 n=1 Tax=Musa balbisiana TaxID=52838 RepID=A0A4S8KA54_MUSBA|nr:hypothetical protein C4D60_Mb04t06860 [Musa balbisiana]
MLAVFCVPPVDPSFGGPARWNGGWERRISSSDRLRAPAPPSPLPPSSIAVVKKKRNLPGTPDPEAEVVALSPRTLLATNRFVCEICSKGFQRDQNLQLHRRGHNLPWKLRQRTGKEPRKRVYVCPEAGCVHHDPSRALGDLTGIKKHFCRKHGEKKWKCDKCSKKYAVQSDWKAHSKICGTREYRCDCGTLFSRRDSFVTHRAFCDALAEESPKTASPPTDPKPSAEDDGEAAAVAETTAAAAVVAPPFSLQQVEPLVRQELENPIGSLRYVPPPSTSIANTSCATASSSSSTSLFASLFASSTTTAAAHTTTFLSDRMVAVGHDDRLLMEPPSLCLATNGAPASLFLPQAQAHGRLPFAPPAPSPHMSATALLQKAAHMVATPTGSSFLEGFGLDAPTGHQEKMIQGSNLQWGQHHHNQPETEPGAPMLSAWLGLGLAYEPDLMTGSSSLFRAKPATTLDLLGLGMAAVGGSAKGRLSALTTSAGGGVDMRSAAATGEWKGAEWKPASASVL